MGGEGGGRGSHLRELGMRSDVLLCLLWPLSNRWSLSYQTLTYLYVLIDCLNGNSSLIKTEELPSVSDPLIGDMAPVSFL